MKRRKLEAYEHLLGTMPDTHVAELAGVDHRAVYKLRVQRGIPSWQQTQRDARFAEVRHLLGRVSDATIAASLGVATVDVRGERVRLGIPSWSETGWEVLEPLRHLLGTKPDVEVAELAGVPRARVTAYRKSLGIKRFSKPPSKRLEALLRPYRDRLGKETDAQIAARVGTSAQIVYNYRTYHDIPSTVSRAWGGPAQDTEPPGGRNAPQVAPPSHPESGQFVWQVLDPEGDGEARYVVAPDLASAAQQVPRGKGLRRVGVLFAD